MLDPGCFPDELATSDVRLGRTFGFRTYYFWDVDLLVGHVFLIPLACHTRESGVK